MINKQANARNSWKTSNRHEPGERLKDVIQSSGRSNIASQEKQLYFKEDPSSSSVSDEDDSLGGLDVVPGSFIVTRRNDIESFGISFGFDYEATQRQVVMFTANGDIWRPLASDITFILPSYIPLNLVERCGTEDVPVGSQLNARTEVLKRLRDLVRELESKYSHISRSVADVYARFKNKDPNAWGEVSVTEVARMIEDNPRYPTIYAVHRHLMNYPLHFVARTPYLITQTFDIRPQNEVRELEKVLAWKRMNDGRILSFVEKAKPIIAETARRLEASALEPPSETPVSPIWNEDDQTIIDFLRMSIRQTRSNQADPYLISRSAIMRLLDPSAPTIDDASVARMLTNLGVFPPWQDLIVIQSTLDIEPEVDSKSERTAKKDKIVERSLAFSPAPNTPLGPEDFYPSDPLEAVRHDFGQLPVFVIDDPNAQELDDGLSIERIPSEPGSYWVHAHIANPTATLPPTHSFAIDAMKQGTTQYLLHHTMPLFPGSLMHHPQVGWSLGAQKGKPSRVLTFSAKIDSSGELVDYQVRAGVINNIHVVSYQSVDKLLGYDMEQLGVIRRPFGGPAPKAAAEPSGLSEAEKGDIKLLHQVSQTLQQWWLRNHTVRPFQVSSRVSVGAFPPGTMTPTLQYRQFQGFPEFKEYVVEGDSSGKGSSMMVAEIMKLAGRVGSRFALKHNVPFIRRTGEGPLFYSPAHREAMMAARRPSGVIGDHEVASNVAAMYPADYSLEPGAHHHIGAIEGEGYSRVTSPLRRALDLVSHWQLQSALLGHSKPTFDVDWMDRFRISFARLEKTRGMAGQYHEAFWQSMFLKRWFSGELRGDGFVPSNPEAVYDGFLLDRGKRSSIGGMFVFRVCVPHLGVRGPVWGVNNDSGRPQPGSMIRVRLKEVILGIKPKVDFEFVEFA
ncbi:hypothetical protein EST38_g9121 [Candolleomyces aberdarensis]|uniref:RNB domain-containing protein n=1 Tax=Candolleomyces aberdarensis TaxID=2316362 RepID=A0A4V1Q2Y7_9AGAR|nr:hypothetical protein EST38_g9121 [Candolleomyces aberdarensis]